MSRSVRCAVNGTEAHLQVEDRDLLVDALRDQLGLKGVHAACGEGACGTCTVLLDGRGVRSCLLFAVQVEGRALTTIEGVSTAEALGPIQRAFADCGAVQCGYCTPGMVLAATELLSGCEHVPSDEEVSAAMVGNLCRCTGYASIVRAVRRAAEELLGPA
jgi:aerobic carbon-monoxide dehydrogenase small subunit